MWRSESGRGEQQEKTVRTLLIGWRNKEAAGREGGGLRGAAQLATYLQYTTILKEIYYTSFLGTTSLRK